MTSPPPPPLAFIYDRQTSLTIGIVQLRLGFCRLRAEEMGWAIGAEFIDQGEDALTDDHRPQLDAMLTAMRDAKTAGRDVLCLVADWYRLSHDATVEDDFRARVTAAGGYTATAVGEDDRPQNGGRTRALRPA